MTTGFGGRIGRRMVAGFLGLTVAVTTLPHAALAGYTLKPEQAAHVSKDEATIAKQVLVATDMQGYGSEAIAAAANAAKTAMRACMTVAYSKTSDPAAVTAMCGPITDAYLVPPPSATVGPLTAAHEQEVRSLQGTMQENLVRKLPDDNSANAVAYTIAVCAKAHLKRNYSWNDMQKGCNPIYKPFANLPPTSDPSSPFYEGASTAQASAAPPKPAESAPQAPPEPAEGEGWAGNSEQQVTVGQDGPTQLQPSQVNLNAGQENRENKSNTNKDDGPCDKCKGGKNESSGSNNNSNSGGGGNSNHKK